MYIDVKTTCNSIGLLLTLIGAWVIYKNSPLNTSSIDGGTSGSDYGAADQKAKNKNKFTTHGVYLILGGTALQLISNYIPA